MTQMSKGCISILRKLLSRRVMGGKHLSKTLCLKWIKNLPKKEHRTALGDLEWCIKEGLILVKPKPSDKHLSLNPRRLNEILELVK